MDEDNIRENIEIYQKALEERYNHNLFKRRELEKLLHNSATLIQKSFRKYMQKKKHSSATLIQRYWRKYQQKVQQYNSKIKKFRHAYAKGIIGFFIYRKVRNLSFSNSWKKNKASSEQLNIIYKQFPVLIHKKMVLKAEYRYLGKYIVFLRNKFDEDWKKYQTKMTKELQKQMNRKWIKKHKNSSTYINDREKEVDGKKYVEKTLDKFYEEAYEKLIKDEKQLSYSQQKIHKVIQSLQLKYQSQF